MSCAFPQRPTLQCARANTTVCTCQFSEPAHRTFKNASSTCLIMNNCLEWIKYLDLQARTKRVWSTLLYLSAVDLLYTTTGVNTMSICHFANIATRGKQYSQCHDDYRYCTSSKKTLAWSHWRKDFRDLEDILSKMTVSSDKCYKLCFLWYYTGT